MRPGERGKTRTRALAGAAALAAALSAASPSPQPFPGIAVPGTDLRLLPECEHTMNRLVLGLDPNQTKFYMLPDTTPWDPRSPDPRVRRLRQQLYWLNFELLHGGIMKAAPEETNFYLSVPDPRIVTESLGNEEEEFREYLRERVGWTQNQIETRIHFFKTPAVVAFPRDMAEPLGRDGRDRLVLGIGSDSDAWYAEPLRRLVAAYPGEFVLKVLPDVNTEGGDLSIVVMPEGNLGVIVGHHRILRYLEARGGVPVKGRRIAPAEIEQARAAYRKAFFGLEPLIVGEEGLTDPQLVTDELFHSDMVVNVLRGRSGVVAFVPSYREAPVDAITQAQLSEAVRDRVQAEYDAVAREFEGRGFRVVRLPLRDHPTRTPVQVGDFVDARTGRQIVLLGKYPYHLDLPGGRNPQRDLQASLERLERSVGAWRLTATPARWAQVEEDIRGVWKELDAGGATPNPTFDMQARIYESEGIRVIPVPIYPTGEGGIHCLLLN